MSALDTIGFAACGLVLMMGLLVPTANAFVPPMYQAQTVSSSSGLFGVRSAVKWGLRTIKKPFQRSSSSSTCSPTPTSTRLPENHESVRERVKVAARAAVLSHEDDEAVNDYRASLTAAFHRHSPSMFDHHHHEHHEVHHVRTALSHHPSENLYEEQDGMISSTSSSTAVQDSRVKRRRLNFQSDEPLYVLPPRTAASMNKLEQEFHDMLSHFSNYSLRDLYALRDPRMRTLVHGVAASADDQAVYRAFEVLFEDLVPLRVAGRLVFKRLKNMMDKCIQAREEEIAHVVQATGLDARDVEEARIVFFEVASKLNHDVYLTAEQLTETRMFHSIHDRLNLESTEELVEKLDRQNNRKIGLEDFLIGLHQCAEDQCELEGHDCYALQVVHELLEEIDSMENPMECETMTAKLMAREAKEKKHVMRYNEMVEIFKGWRKQVPWLWDKQHTGRKWEVVQGCFVGAENQKVVEALRIVYCDYAPLRMAAEFILSLSASLLHLKAEVTQ